MTTKSVYEILMEKAKNSTYSVRQFVLETTNKGEPRNIKYELLDSKGNVVCSVIGTEGNGKAPDFTTNGVWVDNKKIEMEGWQYKDLFGQLGWRFALPQVLKNKQNA